MQGQNAAIYNCSPFGVRIARRGEIELDTLLEVYPPSLVVD